MLLANGQCQKSLALTLVSFPLGEGKGNPQDSSHETLTASARRFRSTLTNPRPLSVVESHHGASTWNRRFLGGLACAAETARGRVTSRGMTGMTYARESGRRTTARWVDGRRTGRDKRSSDVSPWWNAGARDRRSEWSATSDSTTGNI